EASLIEDAQAMIANGQADPEILKRDLFDLVERRERAWNRGFTRRAIQRSQRNRMQTMRWSQVSMIFQGAMNAFNPVYRVGDQIEEALEAHMDMTSEQRQARIQELFKLVGMTADRSDGYPHEFSGGMKLPAPVPARARQLHARTSRTHRGRCGSPLPLPLREGKLRREPRMTEDGAVWDVHGLRKLFPLKAGLLDALRGREKQVHAVD